MKKFIPRDKLSKKEKRALDERRRRTWDQPPIPRVIPNRKKEEEKKKPRPGREDAGWGFLMPWAGETPGNAKSALEFRIIG